ncbi:MAG: HU family DNA-binding protein [Smithellaceae bacterium]|jgi:nucleoid DNA-binding protein
MSEHQNKFTWGKTTINKSDLIATLAAKENLTEKQAIEIINLPFDGFINTLRKGY